MRWYKHFSKAHRDTKIKKLVNDYAAKGYAVYFYCLELIADSIEHDNITFELEDDAILIGQYLKIDTLEVEKIMERCIELDLFGINESGKITCFKMAKFLDERFTRNLELKKLIKSDKMDEIKKQLSSDNAQTIGDNAPQLSIAKLSIAKLSKDIYSAWNNCSNLIKHQENSYKIHENSIHTALNKYSVEEIKTAIEKYNRVKVLSGSLFSYSWILKDFLKRGLDRFVGNQPDSGYCGKNLRKKTNYNFNNKIKNKEKEIYSPVEKISKEKQSELDKTWEEKLSALNKNQPKISLIDKTEKTVHKFYPEYKGIK